MKVEFTYCVYVTVDDEKGIEVEKALLAAAKNFDSAASIEESDAQELDDSETED